MTGTTTRAITQLPGQYVTVAGVKTHYLTGGSCSTRSTLVRWRHRRSPKGIGGV